MMTVSRHATCKYNIKIAFSFEALFTRDSFCLEEEEDNKEEGTKKNEHEFYIC